MLFFKKILVHNYCLLPHASHCQACVCFYIFFIVIYIYIYIYLKYIYFKFFFIFLNHFDILILKIIFLF